MIDPWGHRPWCTAWAPCHELIGDTPVNGINVTPIAKDNSVNPEPLSAESESVIHLLLDLPLGVHVGVDKSDNSVIIRVPRDVLERRLRRVVFQ